MASGTLSNQPDSNNHSPKPLETQDIKHPARNLYSPLSGGPWPQLPHGVEVCLRDLEIDRLYRAAMGVVGLVRLLNRSACLRAEVEDFEEAADYPLSPFDEGNLWSALSELSVDLVSLAEGLHQRALVPAGQSRN